MTLDAEEFRKTVETFLTNLKLRFEGIEERLDRLEKRDKQE